MDESDGCRRPGRGLRRGENLEDIGLDDGVMLSSLSADDDDEGDDGEELYMIYGSLSS
jgi:hypothetical protein